jgi:hypothetical protein
MLSETLRRRTPKQERQHNNNKRQNSNNLTDIAVTFKEVEGRKKTGHVALQFAKFANANNGGLSKNFPSSFTPQELYDMRPGGCFQVDFTSFTTSEQHNLILGSALASTLLCQTS